MIVIGFSPDKFKNTLGWMMAFTVFVTVVLFQMNLPAPTDLLNMKMTYLTMNSHPDLQTTWLTRDPLSYGVMIILSYLFPQQPFVYFLFCSLLNFALLGMIYVNLSRGIEDEKIKRAFMLALFLGFLDYSLSHHYLRQTTGLLILLVALSLVGWRGWLTFGISLIWHGSMILGSPVYLLRRIWESNRKYLYYISALIIFYVVGNLNIYKWLKMEKPEGYTYHDFTFVDRFLNYFQDQRFETFFLSSKEAGNPEFIIYFVASLLTLAFVSWRKWEDKVVYPLLAVFVLWLALFQHNPLVFARIAYVIALLIPLLWILQIKQVRLESKHQIFWIVAVICLLKIHFYVWDFGMSFKGDYLYLKSTASLMNASDWDLSRPLP